MRSSFSRNLNPPGRVIRRCLGAWREKTETESISCCLSSMRCSTSGVQRLLHRGRGIDPYRLVALRLQCLENPPSMRPVARFHRDVQLGALRRHVEEQPAMVDLENVGAELPQPRRELSQHAGPT